MTRKVREPRDRKSPLVRALVRDLRHQLNAILAYSRAVLRSGSLSGSNQEFLDRINCLSESMLRMLNDLLAVPWGEFGRLTLGVRQANLAGLVRDNVAMYRVLAAQKSIELTLDAGSKPILAPVDPHKIELVLSNLISNAIEFAPLGSTVHVAVAQRADDVLISVRDQGPGIAAEEHAALFERFGRAAAGRRAEERRMQLGLPIARYIVEAHRGRIWVESTPGEGATFYVSLPRRRR